MKSLARKYSAADETEKEKIKDILRVKTPQKKELESLVAKLEKMSSKERIIAYSVIFILLSTLIYFVFLGDEQYVEDYNSKIESIRSKS